MDSLAGRRLVIFGCGYVGGAVARAATAHGAKVTALTRNAATAKALEADGIETVVADLTDDSWHSRIPGSPDFLLNCVSSGGGGIEAYRLSYVEGMASIARWARREGGVGTIVYTSSTSVYAQGEGQVVDESAEVGGGGERASLLLEAEAGVRNAAGAWRRWFILRLAGIYGPERHHVLDQVRAGQVSGVGDHRLNLIHRDDAVTAIRACLAAPVDLANEVFNLADDSPTPKCEVVEWLAAELGIPTPRLTGAPAIGRQGLVPDRVISNGKIKALLGWQPRYPTFREGYGSFLSR